MCLKAPFKQDNIGIYSLFSFGGTIFVFCSVIGGFGLVCRPDNNADKNCFLTEKIITVVMIAVLCCS